MSSPLSSIRSDVHLSEAHKIMDRLLIQGNLDDGEATYLADPSDLVAVYEDEHHVIEPASDGDMLRHLLETKGVTQAELSQEASIAKSAISEVLAGKKPFSRQSIRKWAEYFRIDVSVLACNL